MRGEGTRSRRAERREEGTSSRLGREGEEGTSFRPGGRGGEAPSPAWAGEGWGEGGRRPAERSASLSKRWLRLSTLSDAERQTLQSLNKMGVGDRRIGCLDHCPGRQNENQGLDGSGGQS